MFVTTPVAAQDADAGAARVAFTMDSVELAVRGAVLRGVLIMPASAGRHAAVVLVPGARESRFMPLVADSLAVRGVAVLDLDKRGVGSSTGRWDRQSFDGRAQDMAAAIAWLRADTRIDSDRVGVIGHSQGGWIAQMLAADHAGVAFAVLLAAPAQTVRDQILTYERIQHERRGRSAAETERAVASLRRQLGVAGAIRPVCSALRLHYICRIIHFDPMPYLERLTVPVLALYGEVDPMVPPEPNVLLLTEGLRRAGNPDVTVHVFPSANHDFLEAHTGLPEEYHRLHRAYVPGFLDMIVEWVVRRAGSDGERTDDAGAPRFP